MDKYQALSHTTWYFKYHVVSQVVGFIKGKSVIHLAGVYGERKRNFVGQHFWARGFFVDTVGRDEEAIRALISPPRGGPKRWGRVSGPTYRLGRFQS